MKKRVEKKKNNSLWYILGGVFLLLIIAAGIIWAVMRNTEINNSCVDSDNGNIFIKGSVSGYSSNGSFGTFYDYCQSNDTVAEQECQPFERGGKKILSTEPYWCLNWCENGACNEEYYSPDITCEDTPSSYNDCVRFCRFRGMDASSFLKYQWCKCVNLDTNIVLTCPDNICTNRFNGAKTICPQKTQS